MRRFTIALFVTLFALVGVVTSGQQKMSLEEYAKLMKSNAQANAALAKAIDSASYADALAQIRILRENFLALRPFWEERKHNDATTIVQDGLTRLYIMEWLLDRPTAMISQATALAAAKELAPNVCGACHKVYREGTNQTGFKFKEGVF